MHRSVRARLLPTVLAVAGLTASVAPALADFDTVTAYEIESKEQ